MTKPTTCEYCDKFAYITMMDPNLWKPISYCATCIVKGDKAELD